MKYLFSLLLIGVITLTTHAQILQPAQWSYDVSQNSAKVGEVIDLLFRAEIDRDWYLYSSDFDPECGPMVTTFIFIPHSSFELVGDIKAIGAKKKYDEIFECDYTYFRKKALFRQSIKILSNDLRITGGYEYQVCTDVDGKCIPFDDEFDFSKRIAVAAPVILAEETTDEADNSVLEVLATDNEEEPNVTEETEVSEQETTASASKDNESGIREFESFYDGEVTQEKRSNLLFMLVAFLAGLAAIFTPCVFPMIPMTVSFFTNNGGKSKAFLYSISIIAIYTIVGVILAPFMGPEMANHLATEWLPNIIFFLVFLLFALSFFGLFEITLPSSFVNSMDKKSDKGGFIGVFFMAFTLVLVSFSCTGPIVGTILVEAAGGQILKPALGMFAFSLAFAIPFGLFAFFPSLLNNLPKSGGWLNSVKVVLGFLELALAFKFLSIADQAFHWGILDREVNIAIWIVIFTLMGFYLLGKIKLPHDSDLKHVSVPRLMLAVCSFVFVVYLIPGMFGAPLKMLAGYLPPMHTHDFSLTEQINGNSSSNSKSYLVGCEEPKYGDFLHLPHGIQGYFDYDQALACAKKQNKPLFIDFTGHGCTNCREMEAVVWSDPQVLQRLKEDYVVLALYVDDKTELSEDQWYVSAYDNKTKKTIGKQNADFQIQRAQNNAQPNYILLGHDEKALVQSQTYDKSVDAFVKFLDAGKAAMN